MPKSNKDRPISDFMDLSSISPEYRDIALEVGEAYADGLIEDYPEGMRRRSLDFHASRAVPAPVAAAIMTVAVPDGYNSFEGSLLTRIKGDVILAREGSVCVYLVKGATIEGELLEDENDPARDGSGNTRLWWD